MQTSWNTPSQKVLHRRGLQGKYCEGHLMNPELTQGVFTLMVRCSHSNHFFLEAATSRFSSSSARVWIPSGRMIECPSMYSNMAFKLGSSAAEEFSAALQDKIRRIVEVANACRPSATRDSAKVWSPCSNSLISIPMFWHTCSAVLMAFSTSVAAAVMALCKVLLLPKSSA